MSTSLRVSLIAASLAATACTPMYVVVPANGGTMARASSAQRELTLEAVPNAWHDDPPDLARLATPIWVRLVNRGKLGVRVLLADFALTNSSGFSSRAFSAGLVEAKVRETPLTSAAPIHSDRLVDASRTSEWYFDKPGMSDERAELVPVDDGAACVELVRLRGRGAGGGIGGGRGGMGFHSPSGHGYYGPHIYGYFGGYPYWPYYYGPPYRGTYYWGDQPYPRGPTVAMAYKGLPEGTLHSGGVVSGFVYFRDAQTKPDNLELVWSAADATGKRVATLQVPLRAIED